jgi:hypothetical protein
VWQEHDGPGGAGPHATREDTVLFPTFREVVFGLRIRCDGRRFQKRQNLGAHGFEAVMHRVAGLENVIGIEDLKQFTPR